MTSTIDTLARWLGSHGAVPTLEDDDPGSSAVEGMYREILGRVPDPAGGIHLEEMLASGSTAADARRWLAHSRESLALRITATDPFGGMVDRIGPLLVAVQEDDDRPVDVIMLLEVVACYLTVLGRWPDPAGLRDQYRRRSGHDVRSTVEHLTGSAEAQRAWAGSVPPVAASVRDAMSTAQILVLIHVLTVQNLSDRDRDQAGGSSIDDRLERIELMLALLADRRS